MTGWWPIPKSSKISKGASCCCASNFLKIKWRGIFSRWQNGRWIYLGLEILLGQWCDAAYTLEGPILFYFSVLWGGWGSLGVWILMFLMCSHQITIKFSMRSLPVLNKLQSNSQCVPFKFSTYIHLPHRDGFWNKKKKNPPAFLGDWEPAGKFLLTWNLNPEQGLSNDKGLQRRWRWKIAHLGGDGEAVIADHGQAAARTGERAGLATNSAKGMKIFCCYKSFFCFYSN